MSPQDQAGAVASELTDDQDELVGRVLNETYLIEGVLGEGGVGRVYRARHVRINSKRYALKVLHAEHGRDPHQLARFQQEAEAAATLSHPNVVGVFDVGRTEDGTSYLACELLNGIDLDGYLEKRGRLPVPAALSVALQICDALSSAHSQNIVHRDLKPQNVFLLNDADGKLPERPTVKLLDFGLSRFLDQTDTQLTKTGTLMGTPAFMAPEQATGNRGDHRVDIYGIGVVLYASLTGQPPFLEETLPAMLVAVMTEPVPRPSKVVPGIPEALELSIQRAMAKDPDERYQTVDELRLVLEGIYQSVLTESMLPGPLTRPRFGSVYQAEEENFELRTSRPRLVLFGVFGVVLTLVFLASSLSGLELFTGPFEFSKTELVLVVIGICGTILTPAIIAFRHFHRTIWGNSAKVVDVLARLQAPLFSGLVAYGVSTIAIRFFDDFVGRLIESPLFMKNPGLGWPGFTWVLPSVALLVGGAAYARRRLSEGPDGVKRRIWLGTPLTVVTMVAAAALLFFSLKWRALDVSARLAAQVATHDSKPDPILTPEVPGEPAPAPLPPPPPEPIKLASDQELVQAVERGLDGLLPLSEKYPKDARVLEPLLLAFASRATGLADAMVTAKRLIEVAPQKRDSESLGIIVKRSASTPGNASDLAFGLMQGELESSGADLLYDLQRTDPKVEERAKKALKSPDVQAKISPALRIAMDLEAAESCAARLELLPRATHLGDMRSVSILAPLARGSKTGCGKWKNRPCMPTCKTEAKQYLDAVKAIQARSANTDL
jgi:serine/threonine protein kinase